MDKLKDIKPSQIINIDFYFYINILIAILIIVIIYYFIKYLINKKKKKLTTYDISSNFLKNMSFDEETKEIVYSFTLHGANCVSKKSQDEYIQIVSELEQYKYKKDVQSISLSTINNMKNFIKVHI